MREFLYLLGGASAFVAMFVWRTFFFVSAIVMAYAFINKSLDIGDAIMMVLGYALVGFACIIIGGLAMMWAENMKGGDHFSH
ncbi:hypothetical protein [Nitratiruptor tergarcus]|uniref:Uncharacterized protein n=1 Tax=Nitratiruptor tergarcus DSM 16512 TaxID=1069081 RepID=A0A1W1WSK9_9BACT|nr:hypothetical protein [Nitratiruptor tergarcus]SMC09189.1 hypothetical protein SAMN05660197_0994 [Nitratiruptor tergarcus DSM 16512]